MVKYCGNCGQGYESLRCAECMQEPFSLWAPAGVGSDVTDINVGNKQEAKADVGKPRPTLVPVSLMRAVTAVREYGCQKYHDPENWRKVEKQRYRDALYRHWMDYLEGKKVDEESGLPTLWHCACNLAFLIEMEGDNCPNCGARMDGE